MICPIHNLYILAEPKLEIMQHAIAKSPRMSISAHGIQMPSLLDSGSKVMLLRQSYFEQHLLPKIKLAISGKANTHTLFNLIVTNNGQLPIKTYTELNITFLGLKVLNVGMLIIDDPSQVLDKKHQSKLPGTVGWNLALLSCNVFIKNMGHQDLTLLHVQKGVNALLFPNYVSITTLTHVKVMHCPTSLNK